MSPTPGPKYLTCTAVRRGHQGKKRVNTLDSGKVAGLLERLHREAEASDREHLEAMAVAFDPPDGGGQMVSDILAQERADYPTIYRGYADKFLAVSPDYGRFLYAMARASKATRIVEFGTSMGAGERTPRTT
jgi:predicted O-methyltransferase YrrM